MEYKNIEGDVMQEEIQDAIAINIVNIRRESIKKASKLTKKS